jgi:hypothetical protein
MKEIQNITVVGAGTKGRRAFREDKPEGSLGKAHVIQKTRVK